MKETYKLIVWQGSCWAHTHMPWRGLVQGPMYVGLKAGPWYDMFAEPRVEHKLLWYRQEMAQEKKNCSVQHV